MPVWVTICEGDLPVDTGVVTGDDAESPANIEDPRHGWPSRVPARSPGSWPGDQRSLQWKQKRGYYRLIINGKGFIFVGEQMRLAWNKKSPMCLMILHS